MAETKSIRAAHNFKDLTGKTFGKWVVESRGANRGTRSRWNCRCVCGATSLVHGTDLILGKSTRCRQCYYADNTTHGRSKTPEYRTYMSMIHRCHDPSDRCYYLYGQRGISVCQEWRGPDGFNNFLRDMGQRPVGMTIDRRDSDGNYTKENCRWATPVQQGRNIRANRLITIDGETHCMSEWAELAGIRYATFQTRLKKGWNPKDALSVPPLQRRTQSGGPPFCNSGM